MEYGRVISFFQRHHYGFIAPDSTPEDLFFHESCLVRGAPIPQKNDRVSYTLGKYRGKPIAENVRILPRDAQ